MSVPVILLGSGAILLLWKNGWQLAPFSYWAVQQDWFLALNEVLQTLPPVLWLNLTLLGDASVFLAMLSPLLLWRPQAWAAMLGAVPLAASISIIGKHALAMPRPGAVLDPGSYVAIGGILKARNSLPSGHAITEAAAVVAIFATLLPRPRRRRDWAVVLTGMAIIIVTCLSRIAVGAHWPLDILFGVAGGWIAGLSGAAAVRYPAWWRWIDRPRGRRIMAAVLVLLGLLLISRLPDASAGTPVIGLAAAACFFTLAGLLEVRRSGAIVPAAEAGRHSPIA